MNVNMNTMVVCYDYFIRLQTHSIVYRTVCIMRVWWWWWQWRRRRQWMDEMQRLKETNVRRNVLLPKGRNSWVSAPREKVLAQDSKSNSIACVAPMQKKKIFSQKRKNIFLGRWKEHSIWCSCCCSIILAAIVDRRAEQKKGKTRGKIDRAKRIEIQSCARGVCRRVMAYVVSMKM